MFDQRRADKKALTDRGFRAEEDSQRDGQSSVKEALNPDKLALNAVFQRQRASRVWGLVFTREDY